MVGPFFGSKQRNLSKGSVRFGDLCGNGSRPCGSHAFRNVHQLDHRVGKLPRLELSLHDSADRNGEFLCAKARVIDVEFGRGFLEWLVESREAVLDQRHGGCEGKKSEKAQTQEKVLVRSILACFSSRYLPYQKLQGTVAFAESSSDAQLAQSEHSKSV